MLIGNLYLEVLTLVLQNLDIVLRLELSKYEIDKEGIEIDG